MFNQLLESKPQRKRSPGSTAFSIVFHSVIIAGAVWATARAAIKEEKPKQDDIVYYEVKKTDQPPPPPPPKQKTPPPKEPASAGPPSAKPSTVPPPPKGFQVLKAPIDIPTVIPNVDLNRKLTDENDFTGKGVAGGVGKGVVGGTGPIGSEVGGGSSTYYAYQVEKPAKMANGSPRPSYPETLRGAGIEGQVDAQFVVDTNGRAELSSFKVLSSTNDLFTASVRSALPRIRFIPAEAGGHKVRQLVQLPFSFTIER